MIYLLWYFRHVFNLKLSINCNYYILLKIRKQIIRQEPSVGMKHVPRYSIGFKYNYKYKNKNH